MIYTSYNRNNLYIIPYFHRFIHNILNIIFNYNKTPFLLLN